MDTSETREQRLNRLPFIQSALRYEALIAEGRSAAFAFALEVGGDLERIHMELAEQEALLASFENQGPMKPGASPRIYKDSYLAALREAITIITTMTQQGKLWTRTDHAP